MRFLELFAGAGGASMGIEAAGAESVLGIEWDASAVATAQAAGHPTIQGDVRDLSLYDGLEVDALWSSFPCQDWSSAGKRKGASGDRNGWPWTVDVIDKVRPRWFLAENVTGLLQHRGCEKRCKGMHDPEACPRAYFDRVILEQLRERFAWVGFKVLCAADYGTPQFRRRVIICAGPRAIRWPEPTHGKPSGQADLFGRKLKPWVTVRDVLDLSVYSLATAHGPGEVATVMSSSAGGAMWTLDASRNTDAHPNQERPSPATEPSPAIGGKGNLYLNRPSTATEQRLLAINRRPPTDYTDRPAPTTDTFTGSTSDKYEQALRICSYIDRPSPAVLASEVKGSGSGANPHKMQRASDALYLGTGRRRLTVTECLVLMGWPADYPMRGTKTSQYRQAGNGCCPQMVSPMIRAVMAAD